MIIRILISFIIMCVQIYLYVKFSFILFPFTLCRCISCRQRSSRSILSRKRLTTSTNSTSSEDRPILKDLKWQRKVTNDLYSCPANTAPSALFAKAKSLFVIDTTTTTQLQVSSVYLKIFAFCSQFLLCDTL